MPGQRFAQPDFGQARAVERRGVVVAHALRPGRVHGGLRLRFRDVAEHIAQRGGTKAEHVAGQFVFDAHDCSTN
ncbi:hypothetical protein D3C72_1683240 [compost metagenome]